MQTTISSKYQVVIPKPVREHLIKAETEADDN